MTTPTTTPPATAPATVHPVAVASSPPATVPVPGGVKPLAAIMAAPPVLAPRKPRLTLDAIISGRVKSPDKVTLVGLEGVGKTTFGACAPSPVFICAEDGTDEMDTKRFPMPADASMLDVYDAIAALRNGAHAYKTLVVDTVDWLEPLLIRAVCDRNNWHKTLADGVKVPDIDLPGYGKGWEAVADEWRKFLAALDGLRSAKGMAIVLLGHAVLRRWSNPNGEDYERYECSVSKKAWALLRQWSKAVLFAAHEEVVSKKKGEKAKGSYTGKRVLFTERAAGYDAKNRYGLPYMIDLDWSEYATARDKAGESDESETLSEINGLVRSLGLDESEAAKVAAFVTTNKGNSAALRAAKHRLEQRLVSKTEDTNAATGSAQNGQ